MLFVVAAVALAALSQVAGAMPMTSSSTVVKPLVGGMTDMGAKFPVHDLASFGRVTNTTSGAHGGVHVDAAEAIYPATLLLCPAFSCTSCFAFDLSTIPIDECLVDLSSSFNSVAVAQPSNEGLPYAVTVGTAGCATLVGISVVNECFNVNGGPFVDFALIE
ncbi:hypothetical protein C8Q80DRAFT_151361 [Daedaleopsis nitida]|nr:hypothetical protein C8Q80DRAFT_151361 [Daedaleopsis nitida]